MSKKLLLGWAAVVVIGVLVAVQAVASAASTKGAKSATKLEQTKAGAVTYSSCECVCGSPPPGGTPCE